MGDGAYNQTYCEWLLKYFHISNTAGDFPVGCIADIWDNSKPGAVLVRRCQPRLVFVGITPL